ARLRQADLSAAVMNRTSFARADLRDVEAYGAVFTGANFSGANLSGASFVGTYLQGANFAGAVLESTNFSGAEMDRAVGLTQRQLSRACGDSATRLPRGLSIPPC
ncbi:MAG: pentapeptide repeat-containing protein, partial [Phenylobacterium sp.]|nr:pentapeptide repeat-containing protein [Phenylobacterium sp.]